MISPPLCRLSILLMPVLLCSCVSAEKSFRDASARNTAAAYEGFIRGYPENPLAKQAKDRLQEKRDYLAFSAVEQKNTAASYAEFASQNPNNRFAEEAARRSIETDEEAFFRTFRIGSGTAYHGFISTYPDSKYQPDAHEYLSWLVQQRIGISFDEHVSYSSYMDKVTEALLKVGILGVSLTSDQREAQTAFPVVVHFSAIRRTAPSRRYFDVGTQVGMQHGAVGVLIDCRRHSRQSGERRWLCMVDCNC